MDNYRDSIEIKECARCGYNEFKSSLCAHHIDEDRTNGDSCNLLALCFNCHQALHLGLWKLNDIGIESDIQYDRNSGIKRLQSAIATGEAVWNGRGKDKQKRKADGYKLRWEKYRKKREE
jgi:Zn ribbon nucleic-acid-binding protein